MPVKFTTTTSMACAIGLMLGAGPAMAQNAPENAGLPRVGEIRPLPALEDEGPIRNVELDVEFGYAHAVNVNQPTELDQMSLQTSLGVSADLGEDAFAGITGTFSRENIASTNQFAMPMAGVANVLGADAMVGVKPLPFLHFGVLAGVGSGSASYTFTQIPALGATPGNSSTRRLGAFMSAFYGMDRLLLSATATLVDTRTSVDYGPGNMPQTDSFGATLLLGKIGAAYELTDQLTIAGGVTVNHVLSQVVASAQTGLDSTWITVEGGLEYAITPQWSVNAKAATWLLNDRMNFTRVSVGATYSF